MIDVYASQASYWRHLAPVAAELGARGHDVAVWHRGTREWGDHLGRRRRRAPVAVVASWIDARRLDPQPVVYVEHGAGQGYVDGGPGYAGADDLEHVRLFLAPGEPVAEKWRARYPQAAVETVGDPALDQHLHAIRTSRSSLRVTRKQERPLVAVTEHWRCAVAPETWPCLDDYAPELAELAGVELLGHGHPRAHRRARDRWTELGLPFEADPDVVLGRLLAHGQQRALVADNTSLMYEAAALGIPVLALNAPWYRHDVEHGLRFWSHVPGAQCEVGELARVLARVLDDAPELAELRARAVAHVYAHADGTSAARAADAIERL